LSGSGGATGKRAVQPADLRGLAEIGQDEVPALRTAQELLHARVASSLAVTAILVGWALAQYPYIMVGEATIEEAARGRATLVGRHMIVHDT
jgi:hypothetical protein